MQLCIYINNRMPCGDADIVYIISNIITSHVVVHASLFTYKDT